MNPTTRFISYAAAFEEAYGTDDWSKLDSFFTENAVYQPIAGFGGPIQGREVQAYMAAHGDKLKPVG